MERSSPLTPSWSDGRRTRGVEAIFPSSKTSSPTLKTARTTSQKRWIIIYVKILSQKFNLELYQDMHSFCLDKCHEICVGHCSRPLPIITALICGTASVLGSYSKLFSQRPFNGRKKLRQSQVSWHCLLFTPFFQSGQLLQRIDTNVSVWSLFI